MSPLTIRTLAQNIIRETAREHGVDVLVEKKLVQAKEPKEPSSKRAALQALYETYCSCTRCPLGATRTQFVFGDGDPDAQLMFVGEGPGYEEDRGGKPFVGKAGMLLTKIIEAIGLTREKVYIANIVKCHPMIDPTDRDKHGNDRKPDAEEIKKCLPILEQQVDIIKPKVMCALGTVAAQTLTQRTSGIQTVRGKEFEYRGILVIPTFHPAYLLRKPEEKKATWEDMKKIRSKGGF